MSEKPNPSAVEMIDGNTAAARVAYRVSEAIITYPITPATPMGEQADSWASAGELNIWGEIPEVIQMQGEGGVAGALHGALQTGSLATTFTASQGLLLMLPNMYRIAGELTPAVIHVAARTLATHAHSIYGDHSDVMAVIHSGFAMLASSNPQEAQDMALIAHAATLSSRLPFVHFFDGFRTSHEIQKVWMLTDSILRDMIDDAAVAAHRQRALSPESPHIRGTSQPPEVFFQSREAANPYYAAGPDIVQRCMDRFAELSGRAYRLYEYAGDPEAERVIVLMGSGADTATETALRLCRQKERVGVLKVRLFRPFAVKALVAALPKSVRALAVLDRSKSPAGAGEPLYQDVLSALSETAAASGGKMAAPSIVGGRYGLSSKEFTPEMVAGIFRELKKKQPKNHFTIGIRDDVTGHSLKYNKAHPADRDGVFQALFYGMGADDAVSAAKQVLQMVGHHTDLHVQGYFVYDAKKIGAQTCSHLRFGNTPIRSAYHVRSADYIAVHSFALMKRLDVLQYARSGATVLLNAPHPSVEIWDHLPETAQRHCIEKKLRLYIINATRIAQQYGAGRRILTVMQTGFCTVSGILPQREAIRCIKSEIETLYGKTSDELVLKNFEQIDMILERLQAVQLPGETTSRSPLRPAIQGDATEAVRALMEPLIGGNGDALPVSALPADGVFPGGTGRLEKRGISAKIPVWEPDICTQCGLCVMVCPHAVIRAKTCPAALLETAPQTFQSVASQNESDPPETAYTLQISADDCTGCALCVEACPARSRRQSGIKALNMSALPPDMENARNDWSFFLSLPEIDRKEIRDYSVANLQFLQPLFEFPGACAGCGETPYLRLVSQMFGDRMLVANATGCASVYGASLPATPWTSNAKGCGPAWSHSLYEDAAEIGLGFRISIDQRTAEARRRLKTFDTALADIPIAEILSPSRENARDICLQQERIDLLKTALRNLDSPEAAALLSLADDLAHRSVWIVGGDGWANDIGFAGLDHVLSSGRDLNILVLDTETYSNTGGQVSKSTPIGAVAKMAINGKDTPAKDLALHALNYDDVYVARIAMGADTEQTIQAIAGAERYPGVSLVIAYSHCIAHGFNMSRGLTQQQLAVATGHWILFRYDPLLAGTDKNPFQLDTDHIERPLQDYIYNEARYKFLTKMDPLRARDLLKSAQAAVEQRFEHYRQLAERYAPSTTDETDNDQEPFLPYY